MDSGDRKAILLFDDKDQAIEKRVDEFMKDELTKYGMRSAYPPKLPLLCRHSCLLQR